MGDRSSESLVFIAAMTTTLALATTGAARCRALPPAQTPTPAPTHGEHVVTVHFDYDFRQPPPAREAPRSTASNNSSSTIFPPARAKPTARNSSRFPFPPARADLSTASLAPAAIGLRVRQASHRRRRANARRQRVRSPRLHHLDRRALVPQTPSPLYTSSHRVHSPVTRA